MGSRFYPAYPHGGSARCAQWHRESIQDSDADAFLPVGSYRDCFLLSAGSDEGSGVPALGGGILNILKDLNLGFAQFISIGNQADVNAETALEYWENDEDVEQILLYMESIQNPANFRKLASRISRKKPELALKAGRSAAGSL